MRSKTDVHIFGGLINFELVAMLFRSSLCRGSCSRYAWVNDQHREGLAHKFFQEFKILYWESFS